MPNLQDILADKKTFPDEQSIQLADGITTTLGELRGGFLRDGDYRKKTTDLARKGEDLERQYQEKFASLTVAEQKLMDLAKSVVGPKQEPTRDELADLVQNDPVAGRLMGEINQLKAALTQVGGYLKTVDERFQAGQQASLEAQHRSMLAHLKQQDPELDEKELFDYAMKHYTPRLDVAYAAMTRDKAIEKATQKALEEGMQKGYDKAKVELNSPQIPLRRPGQPAENAPKTMDEALERALADPEIVNPLYGIRS